MMGRELDALAKQSAGQRRGLAPVAADWLRRCRVADRTGAGLAKPLPGRRGGRAGHAAFPDDQLLAAFSGNDWCLAPLVAAEYLFDWRDDLDSGAADLAHPAFLCLERLATCRAGAIGKRPGAERVRRHPLAALADGARLAGTSGCANIRDCAK